MKRILLMTAAALVAAVSFTSCHRADVPSDGTESEPQTTNAGSSILRYRSWTRIEPQDLEMKPIERISKDWMALSMGNVRNFNSMTISWGAIGQLWNKPVMIVFVSSDRASKKLMDGNNYFTVSGFPESKKCREALEYLGSHSYKDDPEKVRNSGLNVEFSELGNPMFDEADLTIECRKIYAEEFTKDKLPPDVRDRIYSNLGMHTMYIGEIVNVYEKR